MKKTLFTLGAVALLATSPLFAVESTQVKTQTKSSIQTQTQTNLNNGTGLGKGKNSIYTKEVTSIKVLNQINQVVVVKAKVNANKV